MIKRHETGKLFSWLKQLCDAMPGVGWINGKLHLPAALNWVDEFIASVRPYVMVRLEDSLLIRMPNQAHRLNPAGTKVLHYLLSGGTAAELAAAIGQDQQRINDIGRFLYDVRRCLSGELREDNATCAVEIVPLDVHFSDFPVLSEMALTDRCNLRCIFCYAGCTKSSVLPAESHQPPRHEMSTAEVKEVLGRIRNQAHVPSVSFTGGEPLLRKDLPDLVRFAAKNLGMRVNLITNGTLVTPRLAGQLADAGLASAQVSIEGPNAWSHESITGISGSFDRSCMAVHHFRDAGVTVHCNTTINRFNIHVVTEMPRFARDTLGSDRISMNMVIPAGTAAELPGESADSPLLRYSEISPVVLAVREAGIRAGVEFMWYSPTPLCIFNPILEDLGNKGCSACDGLLSVDAYGRILPCSSCNDPVGDLLHEDFQTIWNRTLSETYRNKGLAHPDCHVCDHFAFCHGACPLYWKYFGFEELVNVCGFKNNEDKELVL